MSGTGAVRGSNGWEKRAEDRNAASAEIDYSGGAKASILGPMEFIKASANPPDGLHEFLLELGEGEHGFHGSNYAEGNTSLEDYLRMLVEMSRGRHLKPGLTAMTTYWVLGDDGQLIGMSRLRHSLTEQTLNRGGNIGYYVRPGQRRKGYATRILAHMLEEARRIGLGRVLLTTEADNVGSIAVITANGGHLEDERMDKRTGRPFRRYWIELADA